MFGFGRSNESRERREQLDLLKSRQSNAKWTTPDTFEMNVNTRFGPLPISVHIPMDYPNSPPALRILVPGQHPWVSSSGAIDHMPSIRNWSSRSHPSVMDIISGLTAQFSQNPPTPAAPAPPRPTHSSSAYPGQAINRSPAAVPPAPQGYPGSHSSYSVHNNGRPSPQAPYTAPSYGGIPAPPAYGHQPTPYNAAYVPPPPSSTRSSHSPYSSTYTAPPPHGASAYTAAVPSPPSQPAYGAHSYNVPPPSSSGYHSPAATPPTMAPRTLTTPTTSASNTPNYVLRPLDRAVVESMSTEQLQELDNDQAKVRAFVLDMLDLKAIRKDEEDLEKEIAEIKIKRENIDKPEESANDDDVNYAELHKKEVEALTKTRIAYADVMAKFSITAVCNGLDDKIMAANVQSDDILEKMGSASDHDMSNLLNQYIDSQKQVQLNQILREKVLANNRPNRA